MKTKEFWVYERYVDAFSKEQFVRQATFQKENHAMSFTKAVKPELGQWEIVCSENFDEWSRRVNEKT